jgi:AcrR family transcriptional regulator
VTHDEFRPYRGTGSYMVRSDRLFFRSLPMPPGPEAVAADQRARMLDAMTRVVVRKGFAHTTVADVVELAGVSRRTFYEQFADKEECFLAAYETAAQAVLDDIADAVRAVADAGWRRRLHRSLETYTEVLSASPEAAKLFLIDVMGAGDRAVALRRQVLDRFVEQFRAMRAIDSDLADVPDPLLRALVGGINELVQDHIARHGAGTLPELAPTLEDVAHAILERSRLHHRV